MTIKLKSLKADLQRENAGDWIAAPTLPGVEFKVRALTYGPFQTKRDQALMRLARIHGDNAPLPEVQKELGRLLAEEILIDWKGFDVPYSQDVALEVLTDEGHRDLRLAVENAASRLASVKVEFIEEQGKKSEKRSEPA